MRVSRARKRRASAASCSAVQQPKAEYCAQKLSGCGGRKGGLKSKHCGCAAASRARRTSSAPGPIRATARRPAILLPVCRNSSQRPASPAGAPPRSHWPRPERPPPALLAPSREITGKPVDSPYRPRVQGLPSLKVTSAWEHSAGLEDHGTLQLPLCGQPPPSGPSLSKPGVWEAPVAQFHSSTSLRCLLAAK